MIYHGVRQTASGSIYRLGLALFDLNQPEICLQRGDSWMFGPEAPYERGGDVKDVVFPCGQTIGADGDTIILITGQPIPAWPWRRKHSLSSLRGWTRIRARRKLTGERPREFGYATGILNQAPYLMTQHVQTNITLL